MAQCTRYSLEARYFASFLSLPRRSIRTIISGCRAPLKIPPGVIQISPESSSHRALIFPPVAVSRHLEYNSLLIFTIWRRTSLSSSTGCIVIGFTFLFNRSTGTWLMVSPNTGYTSEQFYDHSNRYFGEIIV